MNKKGQVLQVLLFMSIILVMGVTAVITFYIINQFYGGLAEMNVTNADMAKAETTVRNTANSVDYAIVFLMVALIGGLIVTSFLIPSHPIFMVINIIGIFVLVFGGMIMSNVYGEIVYGEAGTESNISGMADTFTYTTFMINYLPYIAAVIIGLLSVIMFARGSGGGNY